MKKLATGNRVTAAEVNAAIADMFKPEEWATLFDVGNQTGFGRGIQYRRADALSLNTWPSRGMELNGFEVKVHRHDWTREKDDPAKSASIQRFCDRWWLVVGSEDVIRDGELPVTWGLYVLEKRKLKLKVQAPKLTPEPWPKYFVAAMLRAATKGVVPKTALHAMAEDLFEKRRESNKTWKESQFDRQEKELQELRQRLQDFQDASGVDIAAHHKWGDMADPKMLGAAVKFVIDRGLGHNNLIAIKNLLNVATQEVEAAIGLADKLPKVQRPEKDEKETAAQ